jgi:hypothetical protein
VLQLQDKKTKKGDVLSIPITKLEKYKFEIMWTKIMQIKKEIHEEMRQKHEQDLKR